MPNSADPDQLASSKGLQRQGVYGLSRTRVKFCVKLLIANPFTPDFLKWTLQSLNLDESIISKRDVM